MLYPPRAAGRNLLEHAYYLPDKVLKVYREVIAAMNAELPLLAAIGLRTLIQAVCHDQEAKGDRLDKRIDSLASLGVLSKPQAGILHNHRFLGNVAAHEITAPQPAELVAALKIAETILATLYVIPKLQEDIKTGKVNPQAVQPAMKAERKSAEECGR